MAAEFRQVFEEQRFGLPLDDSLLSLGGRVRLSDMRILITAILLAIWFVVTFVEGWYARELNNITFFGFPFGFYMSAQGSLIIFVVLIFWYAARQNRIDEECGVAESE